MDRLPARQAGAPSPSRALSTSESESENSIAFSEEQEAHRENGYRSLLDRLTPSEEAPTTTFVSTLFTPLISSASTPTSSHREQLLDELKEWYALAEPDAKPPAKKRAKTDHGADHRESRPKRRTHLNLPLPLTDQQCGQIRHFLNRLKKSAEFRHGPQAKMLLAQRVTDLLEQLWLNSDFLNSALYHIEQGLTNCEDRTLLMLNRIEIQLRIIHAEQSPDPEQALRALALGLIKWETVQEHAEQSCQSLLHSRPRQNEIDEIQIYLRYESRLAERLGLPLSTRHMLYPAQVDESELEAAALAAQAAADNPETLEHYLNNWAPWQQLQRKKAAESLTWAELPIVHGSADPDAYCPFTLKPYEELEEPVALPGCTAAIEFAELKQWWIENGTHPIITHQPLERSDFTRFNRHPASTSQPLISSERH